MDELSFCSLIISVLKKRRKKEQNAPGETLAPIQIEVM